MNVKRLMALAFVPIEDVIKGYSLIINDFDQDVNDLLDYFEKVWVGQKKGRGMYQLKHTY